MDDDGQLIELIVERFGDRLDSYIAEFTDLSRSRAEQLIGAGRVTVNGSIPRKRDRPQVGDRISIRVPPPDVARMAPEAIHIDIVYQDDDIAIIDKPA